MNEPLRSTAASEAVALPQFTAELPHQFEPLLNDEDAARLLGNMHPRTLQRLARVGIVPAVKIGRFWFFRASTLDAWVNSRVEFTHRPCFSKENK